MFSSCGLYISIIFLNTPSQLGSRDYGLMIIQTGMKVDVCTALAFNTLYFCSSFSSFQFVIKLLTTLDIRICYRLM
jgi:hypothetical protein